MALALALAGCSATHQEAQSSKVRDAAKACPYGLKQLDFSTDGTGQIEHVVAREQDGLSLPWKGRVWVNPPYGTQAGAWVRKLAEHGHGIALVFSRTDVRWWHAAVPSATAVCFIRGRLTFIAGAGQSAPGNSGGPSALIAYGEDCAKAVAESGLGLTYFSGEALGGGGRGGR